MARGWTFGLALAVAFAGLAGAAEAQDSGKPVGKWSRKVGKTQVVLEIEEGRLHVRIHGETSAVVHADYNITRDRTIYGVVTSLESDEDDTEEMEKELVDQPFSCRFRVDEGVLIVREVKSGLSDRKEIPWAGRYKAVEVERPNRSVAPPPPPVAVPSAPPVAPTIRGSSDPLIGPPPVNPPLPPSPTSVPSCSSSTGASSLTNEQVFSFWQSFFR